MGGRKRRRVIYAICPKATRTTSACRPELERCPDGIGRARRDGGSDWVGRRVTKRGRPSSRQDVGRGPKDEHARSEEHTSELQSLMRISYAVFCLKKKQTQLITTTAITL